jgi:hypothetical protein
MYSLSGNGDWHISYDRVLDTVIGIGLTLIAGRVLFPVWERNNYVNRFSDVLDAMVNYLDSILPKFKDDQVTLSGFIELNREIELAAVVANSSFQQALSQPRFNTKLIPYIMSFLNSSNRFIRGIISLYEYLEITKTPIGNSEIIIKVGQKMVDLIKVLSKIILSQKPNEVHFDKKVVRLLVEMESMMKELEETYINLSNESSFEKNVFTIEIKRLLEIVHDMVNEINSIASINMGLSAEDDYFAA